MNRSQLWVGGIALAMIALALLLLLMRAQPASQIVQAPSVTTAVDSATPAIPKPPSPTTPTMAPIALPPAQHSDGEVVVHGRWGSAPGQFGRRRDPESSPEAPMAVAAGARGELAIVDQINRRVQRWKDGKLRASVALGGDTAQDVALAPGGRTVVLDRLGDKNVQLYDASGKLANELSLAGKGVPESGGVTGVFSDESGVYVEREHSALVRLGDANGQSDATRPEWLGRPSRDGRTLVQVAIVERAAGELRVSASDRASGQPSWTQTLRLGLPILHVVMVDTDRQGRVYIAADVGRESSVAPFPIFDEQLLIFRLDASGAPHGALGLPPLPTGTESVRPISVDDDGAIYVMTATDSGLTVTRYVLP